MRQPMLCVAGGLMLLAGCEGTGADYRPTLDGPENAHFRADLTECQQTARSHGAGNTLGGALAGAALLGVIGAAVKPDPGDDRLANAAGAALLGAASGAAAASSGTMDEQEDVVRNCLIGRGHRVIL